MAVAKRNIQESIPIPTSLTEAQRIEVGNRIVSEIRERTRRGVDKSGKAFPGYSKEYGKTGTPNLSKTGDMLATLDVLSISNSSITIGYEITDPNAGQVEGNTIGSYGQPTSNSKKARDFIGIPNKVLNLIIAEVKADPDFEATSNARADIVNSIIGNING